MSGVCRLFGAAAKPPHSGMVRTRAQAGAAEAPHEKARRQAALAQAGRLRDIAPPGGDQERMAVARRASDQGEVVEKRDEAPPLMAASLPEAQPIAQAESRTPDTARIAAGALLVVAVGLVVGCGKFLIAHGVAESSTVAGAVLGIHEVGVGIIMAGIGTGTALFGAQLIASGLGLGAQERHMMGSELEIRPGRCYPAA